MAISSYKKLTKVASGDQKVKSLKQLKSLFLGKHVDIDVQDTSIEDQCGARLVHNLNEDYSTTEIVAYLLEKFYHDDGERKIAQILFSDTVDEYGKKGWKDVKANCHKGPVSINPNTEARIQFYIVVPQDLVAIYNAQFKK